MAIKVGMVSLGCPKNQVDAEIMLHLIREGGFELVGDAALADVVIINTCGFIESAKQESIEQILEFYKLKLEGRIKCIIVTGCMAERYRQELLDEMPEADVVVGIGCNSRIIEAIEQALRGQRGLLCDEKYKLPLSGKRVMTTMPYYAYLKISEGCDNCCTYCAIPQIRGRYRSRPFDEIIDEAKALAAQGVKELILVAQDTTRYGEDLYSDTGLSELLETLDQIEGLVWIRLLYCYPERITNRLLDTINRCKKVVKYLDLPIQHCNSEVLRNMNRTGDRDWLCNLVKNIRKRVENITLRTTLIAGFPGETEAQFTELLDFVKSVQFDRLGCFAYSQEEGTVAAKMDDQLNEQTKTRRAELIMLEQTRIMEQKNREKIGTTRCVLVEGFDRYAECYFGRSEADAPEIDGKVFFTAQTPLQAGQFVEVLIEEVMEYDIMGSAVSQ